MFRGRKMKILVCVLVSMFIPAKWAFAESVKLKNGSIVQGTIEQMSPTDIIINTPNLGKISIKRNNVESISEITVSQTQPQPNVSVPAVASETKPVTTTNFAPLTPTLTLQESHKPKEKSEWFFGVGVGFMDLDSVFYLGSTIYDFTLLGYRFESGFSLSLSTQLSDGAFDLSLIHI